MLIAKIKIDVKFKLNVSKQTLQSFRAPKSTGNRLQNLVSKITATFIRNQTIFVINNKE